MGLLIDSDIIIDFLNNQKSAINFFKNSVNKRIDISIISWIEVVYGFKKNKLLDKTKIFQELLNDYNISVLQIDEKISLEYLNIKIDLENKKIVLGDFDLLIAATAKSKNLKLVTRNIRHFLRIKDLQLF